MTILSERRLRMLSGLKRHWRIAAIVALCSYVVLFWLWAYSGFPAQDKICDQGAQASNHNCAARQIISVVHWVGVYHDVLLAVGTFLLAAVVIIQIRDGRKSSERQLRAYISVEPGSVTKQRRKRKTRFDFRPVIFNNGQTPAYDVHIESRVGLINSPLPDDFDFTVAETPNPSVTAIGPRQTRFHTAVLNDYLGIAELRDCIASKKVFHQYGTVFYKDAFGNDRHTNLAS